MRSITHLCKGIAVAIMSASILGQCGCPGEAPEENTLDYPSFRSQTRSDLLSIYEVDPNHIPEAEEDTLYSRDGIDITIHSQSGIIDYSGTKYETVQYVEFENSIEQLTTNYSLRMQPLDEMAVGSAIYNPTVTIGDRTYIYSKAPYSNGVVLLLPIDDEHYLNITVEDFHSFDKEGHSNPVWGDVLQLMQEESFCKALLFDIKGAGELTYNPTVKEELISADITDTVLSDELPYSYEPGNRFYMKDSSAEDLVTEDGYTYVKNQLLLDGDLGTEYETVEALADAYGFDIVGCIEGIVCYQLESREDKTREELEEVAAELEELDWVMLCYLNEVINTSIDSPIEE